MSDWRDGYDVWKLATPPEYDITPEQEAELEAEYREREEHDWLASWSDDFHSDEWAAVADTRPNTDLRDFAWLLLTLCVVIIGGAGILEWRMG